MDLTASSAKETEIGLSFAALLHPESESLFFEQAWQKCPFVVKRGQPGYFASIFSLADLDSLISLSANVSRQHLRLVKTEGGHLNERPLELNPDGTSDVYAAYRAYMDGFSIVANSLDTRWLPVARLCRNLEKELRQRVVANLYVTPADAQGFTPHYDTHDVVVLQLEGSKQWRIFRPVVSLPLEDSNAPIEQSHLEQPYRELLMEAGDLLYLPRGWVHEAATSRVSSIHLTLGIHVTKWLDVLLDAIVMGAADDEELRATFPFKSLEEDDLSLEDAVTKMRELVTRIASSMPAEAAINARARRTLMSSGPAPDGHFANLDRLAGLSNESVLSHRAGMVCSVSSSSAEAVIHFRGNSVRGPSSIEAALRFISVTPTFAVSDLPDLDDEAKLVLARRLVTEGLLSSS